MMKSAPMRDNEGRADSSVLFGAKKKLLILQIQHD